MAINLDARTEIVTGAGTGLGRSHAHALASAGANVVVNDLSSDAAEAVAQEIVAAGGNAIAIAASVTDYPGVQAMVAATMREWGRVDILVNNAGSLRDRSLTKMNLEDFRLVLEVHLMGAVHCTKAVWDIMRRQRYGRIIMTASGTGLFGNFGQANYGAAKAALVGLMQTLSIEGGNDDIRVNSIVPVAATAMTDQLFTPAMLSLIAPEAVSPGVVYLASEDAPTRMILCAGGGAFATADVTLNMGLFAGDGDAADLLSRERQSLEDRDQAIVPQSVAQQIEAHLFHARRTRGEG